MTGTRRDPCDHQGYPRNESTPWVNLLRCCVPFPLLVYGSMAYLQLRSTAHLCKLIICVFWGMIVRLPDGLTYLLSKLFVWAVRFCCQDVLLEYLAAAIMAGQESRIAACIRLLIHRPDDADVAVSIARLSLAKHQPAVLDKIVYEFLRHGHVRTACTFFEMLMMSSSASPNGQSSSGEQWSSRAGGSQPRPASNSSAILDDVSSQSFHSISRELRYPIAQMLADGYSDAISNFVVQVFDSGSPNVLHELFSTWLAQIHSERTSSANNNSTFSGTTTTNNNDDKDSSPCTPQPGTDAGGDRGRGGVDDDGIQVVLRHLIAIGRGDIVEQVLASTSKRNGVRCSATELTSLVGWALEEGHQSAAAHVVSRVVQLGWCEVVVEMARIMTSNEQPANAIGEIVRTMAKYEQGNAFGEFMFEMVYKADYFLARTVVDEGMRSGMAGGTMGELLVDTVLRLVKTGAVDNLAIFSEMLASPPRENVFISLLRNLSARGYQKLAGNLMVATEKLAVTERINSYENAVAWEE